MNREMIDAQARDVSARERIVLVKTSSVFGQQMAGSSYEIVGRAGESVEKLRARAFSMLLRSMPDENLMEWEIADG